MLFATSSFESDFLWSTATQMVEQVPGPSTKSPNLTLFYLITYIADVWYT